MKSQDKAKTLFLRFILAIINLNLLFFFRDIPDGMLKFIAAAVIIILNTFIVLA